MRDDDTGLEIKTNNMMYMDGNIVMTRQWYGKGPHQKMVEFPADSISAQDFMVHRNRTPLIWQPGDEEQDERTEKAKKVKAMRDAGIWKRTR